MPLCIANLCFFTPSLDAKKVWHNSHSNNLNLSWAVVVWHFSLYFVTKAFPHLSHPKFLTLLWTCIMWLFKIGFVANFLVQLLHSKFRSLSCFTLTCSRSKQFATNPSLHWVQAKGLMFWCIVKLCLLTPPFVAKKEWQTSHSKGRALSWTILMWASKIQFFSNFLKQVLHSNFFPNWSCTICSCLLRHLMFNITKLHFSHLTGNSLSWTFLWINSSLLYANSALQTSHLKSLLLRWTCVLCLSICSTVANVFEQDSHWWGLKLSWTWKMRWLKIRLNLGS